VTVASVISIGFGAITFIDKRLPSFERS
jgi:hypothetical protein